MPRQFAPSLDYRPRSGFVERFEKQPHIPRHVDVLFPQQACFVAAQLLINAMIEENNRQSLQGSFLDPNGDECRRWDRLGAVDSILEAIRSTGLQCCFHRVVEAIVTLCFCNARNSSMLDTDEIMTLAGIAYGVGVSVRRDLPHIATRWVEESIS